MNVPDDVRRSAVASIANRWHALKDCPGDMYEREAAELFDAALSALEAAGWKPVRIDVLEPFRRAAEALNEYDPGFPDEGSILRMSAEWYMRTHEAGEKLNKPLTAGDLRALAAMLTASQGKEQEK